MNQTRASSRAWCIEWIMFLTYSFFAVNWIAGSTLTPEIMESFNLTSMASASLISNAITIAKIIGNFLAASILVKLLPKKAIGLGSLLILAGCIAAIAAGSNPVFILGRFIMGFVGALYGVYFSPMVLHYFQGSSGQAASKSVGHVQFSGTGGQSETVSAAQRSKGGKFILAMHSTYTKKMRMAIRSSAQ